MKVWIIEYCDADGIARDCYPDFCYSAGEANLIAPEFMAAMAACGPDGAWAKSWRIVEEEMPPDQGERRHRMLRPRRTRRARGRVQPSPGA
jgi:hypothetical protein